MGVKKAVRLSGMFGTPEHTVCHSEMSRQCKGTRKRRTNRNRVIGWNIP
jgi:hypothetical protein